MTGNLDPLIHDLVEWVAKAPRTYIEVIEVWRTSCPRLTVWEDAVDCGYVEHRTIEGIGACVIVTEAGHEFLQNRRQRADAIAAPSSQSSVPLSTA